MVAPRQLKVDGFTIDYAAVADDLESGMVELRGGVERLARARKRLEGAILTKRESIDVFRSTLIWAGRSSEGLFHRAGEPELARRIRSSTRRPLRPSEQPEDGDEPSPATALSSAASQASPTATQPVSGSDEPSPTASEPILGSTEPPTASS